MGIGHFGVALIAKRVEPRLSLGTAALAAMLADFICFALLIAGIEHFSAVPGAKLNLMLGDNIVWSHSLLMDVVWGAIFAGIFYAARHLARPAWILFACVVSHWVLDVISHRPDLALAPGTEVRLGFGLWNSYPATLVFEGGFWLLALILYVSAIKAKSRAGAIAFWAGVALLTAIGLTNPRNGIDPNPVRAGMGGLIVFSIFVAWAYWMDRIRIQSQPETPLDSAARRSLR